MNQPIAALEAEKLLIGGILVNGSLIHESRAALTPGDFFSGQHRRIFVLLGEMADAGRDIDLLAFIQYVQDRKLEHEMLISITSDCQAGSMRRPSLSEYIAEIREKSQLRAIAELGQELTERAYGRQDAAELIIAESDKKLLEIAASGVDSLVSLEQSTYDTLSAIDSQRRGETTPCFPTGIDQLDGFVGGLGKGELTVLGGRPGMGKSSLVLQAVIANCRRDTFCHVFSVEMTSGQLLRRLWAAVSGVSFHRVRHPQRMNDVEAAEIRKAAMLVSGWPLLIDDTANLSVEQLIARARGSKRKYGTGIVAIDYLQKLRFSRKLEMRYLDVTNAAVSLAQLAKEEQVAVLLLSSLTEKSGKDRNSPPSLSDFRQSGDIAFEAHNAFLLHRTVDEESQQISNDTAIIVAKARADRTGNVRATFNTDSLLFDPIDGGRSHVM